MLRILVYVGARLLMPDRARLKDLTAPLNMHNKIRVRRCPSASIVANNHQERWWPYLDKRRIAAFA